MAKKKQADRSVRDALRSVAGHLPATDSVPVGPDSKKKANEHLALIAPRLAELQDRLYAEGTVGGGTRSVLLVLQGMDTSGKDGTVAHVCGLVNPRGLHIASFKQPTRAELRHDFLWRIRKQLPTPGTIGVFNRSHYEDVLVVRVDELVPHDVWDARFGLINEFEEELVSTGTTIVKCFLHISPDEQRERLLSRLEDQTKRWKYNPDDVDNRAKWGRYEQAYADVLERCSTEHAPWYVVPADRKWYRNWAIANLLLETLAEMHPRLPLPDYDVDAELSRLRKHDPLE